MQTIQWKKTIAQIALPQERSLGFFKKKYSLLLTYSVELTRPKSAIEREVLKQHQNVFETLEKQFPIAENTLTLEFNSTPLIPKQEPETEIMFRKILVKDFEVNKTVFEEYKNQKTFPIKYNPQQPYTIKH